MPVRPRTKRTIETDTTHNRVYRVTSEKANEVAERWGTSKIELYRYLVELADEGKINNPSQAAK